MAIVDTSCDTFADIKNHLIAENNDENLSTIMGQILALIPKKDLLSHEQAESLLSVFDGWFKKALSSTANKRLSPSLYALTIKFIDKIHKSKQNIFNLPEKANPTLLYLIYEKINRHIWMLIEQEQDSQTLRTAALAAIQTVQKLQYFAKDISLPTPSSPKEKEKINPVEKDMELLSKIYYGSTNNEIITLFHNLNAADAIITLNNLFKELTQFSQALPQLLKDLNLIETSLKADILKQTFLNLNNLSITGLSYYAKTNDITILQQYADLENTIKVISELATEEEISDLNLLLNMLNVQILFSTAPNDLQKELEIASAFLNHASLLETTLSKAQTAITNLWVTQKLKLKSESNDIPLEEFLLDQLFFIMSNIIGQQLDRTLVSLSNEKAQIVLSYFNISTLAFYANFPRTNQTQIKAIISNVSSTTEIYYYLKHAWLTYQEKQTPLLITFLGSLAYLVINNVKKLKTNEYLMSLILNVFIEMLPILKEQQHFFIMYLSLLTILEQHKVPHDKLKDSLINFIKDWHQQEPQTVKRMICTSISVNDKVSSTNNAQPIGSNFLCLALFSEYLSYKERTEFFEKSLSFLYQSIVQQHRGIMGKNQKFTSPLFRIDQQVIFQIINIIEKIPINKNTYQSQIELLTELPDLFKAVDTLNKKSPKLKNKHIKDNSLFPKLQKNIQQLFQEMTKHKQNKALQNIIVFVTQILLKILIQELIETPLGDLNKSLEIAITKDLQNKNSTQVRELLSQYPKNELSSRLGADFANHFKSIESLADILITQSKTQTNEVQEDIKKFTDVTKVLLELYKQSQSQISDDDLLAAFEPQKPKKRKAKKKKPTKAKETIKPKLAQEAGHNTQAKVLAQKPQQPLQQVGIFAQQQPAPSLPYSKALKSVKNQTLDWFDALNKGKHHKGVDFPSILKKIKANLEKITNEKLDPTTYRQLYIRIKKQVTVLDLRSFKYAINSNNLYRNILELYNEASFKTPEENKEYAYTTCFQIYRRCLPDGKLSAKQTHPDYWRDYCDIIVALNTLLRMSVNAPIELQQPIKRSKSIC